MDFPDVSIVIPAYNEAGAIESTVNSYLKLNLKCGFEIVVVDNNSRDGTDKIVESISNKFPNVRLVSRIGKSGGFGSTLLDGTSGAKGKYVIWTMADGCDDLSAVPEMIAKLESGHDLVIGSRNCKGSSRGNQPKLKAVCSSGYSALMKLGFKMPVSDSTNAFRAFRKEIIDSLNLKADDFSISPEFSIKANKAGFRLGEVPVQYKERDKGNTKFNLAKMGRVYARLFLECLK
jgi:glycosyltransferase involved in cell wall biosynthesis